MQSTDFLVIGSGIAGLTFALKAAEHGRVVIVTKKDDTESNTNYAQGGIAAVFGPDDSAASHIKDTIEAGAGLSNPEAVQTSQGRIQGNLSVRGTWEKPSLEGDLELAEAGADILLMPSRYEPCGLDQLYALKYGTIPIVRAVGGLEDTVEDYNPQTDQGTGFKFKEYELEKLFETLQRALSVYRDKPRWRRLIQRAMSQDFSWGKSAAQYQSLYQKALEKKGKG